MRRALAAAVVAAAVAPSAALADSQQVLLPGPTPYPTPSPPLTTTAPQVGATLTFRIHAGSDQRVTAGVDSEGRVISLRALQNLHLTGTGDYLIVVPSPVLDVRAGPGSQSEPGQRRGQILWAGFASRRRLLSADATLRPGPVRPFLPLRLHASRDGDRYTLTLANETETSQVAFQGAAAKRELASALDGTRRQSLLRRRLTPVYVTIDGLVSQRPQKARIAAPLLVTGELRFPRAPSSAVGGTVVGRSVRFSFVLGDEQPLNRRIEVTGGGEPQVHVEAKPTAVVRGLRPPGGAASWRSSRMPADALLRRLIDTRMELVRSDQYQAFLANPDPLGRNRTVYVYETAAVAHAAPAAASPSGGGVGTLVVLLAVAGAVVAAGAGVVAWAHS